MRLFTRGFDVVEANLDRFAADARKAYLAAVRLQAEEIMTASQREVPVKTGNLKNSKFFELKPTSDGANVTMGYRAFYAVYVHEIDRNYTVGKWKYLEDPIKQALPEFGEKVALQTAKSLNKLGWK